MVNLDRGMLTLRDIRQHYLVTTDCTQKLDVLCDLYETLEFAQAIIHCNSRRSAEYVAMGMKVRDHEVTAVHDGLNRDDRRRNMRNFRGGGARAIVVNTGTVRGQVELVVNYDLPMSAEGYMWRAGRHSRYSRRGWAISLVSSERLAS